MKSAFPARSDTNVKEPPRKAADERGRDSLLPTARVRFRSIPWAALALAAGASAQESSPLARNPESMSARHGAFDPYRAGQLTLGMGAALSGRVTLPDGSPPREPALIERVCEGRVYSDAYTDDKGRFRFEIGADVSVGFASASVEGVNRLDTDPLGGGLSAGDRRSGVANLIGRRLRAALAGYRSSEIELGRRTRFDRPDVGVLILEPLDPSSASAFVSATTLAAPKKARRAYEKARRTLTRRRPRRDEAADALEEAVEIYPRYAVAWTLLGRLRLDLGDRDASREAFERALEADPDFRGPRLPLALLALGAGDWETAAQHCAALAERSPSLPEPLYYGGLALFNLGRFAEARAHLLRVFGLGAAPAFPHIRHLLASVMAREGDFEAAATQLRAFLREHPDDALAEEARAYLLDWERRGWISQAALPDPPANVR